MIIQPYRRRLGTVRKYVPTGKDLPFADRSDMRDQAYWTLMGWVEDEFGPEGGTPDEIYHQVTGPRGLTADTTMELLYSAKRGGYFK